MIGQKILNSPKILSEYKISLDTWSLVHWCSEWVYQLTIRSQKNIFGIFRGKKPYDVFFMFLNCLVNNNVLFYSKRLILSNVFLKFEFSVLFRITSNKRPFKGLGTFCEFSRRPTMVDDNFSTTLVPSIEILSRDPWNRDLLSVCFKLSHFLTLWISKWLCLSQNSLT